MPIKCLILEDEPLAQNVLRNYIQQFSGLELIGIYGDPVEAQAFIHRAKPDIIFLDINLPKISGINFLKALSNPPLIIFTTAYQDFALEGFELNAVDYLLKPFSLERFIKAVNKAMQRLEPREETKTDEEALFVKVDKKLYRVATEEILYLEALDDYVKVATSTKEFLTNNTLKNLQDELPPSRFMRVHKSYLVCIGKIDYIEGNYIRMGSKEIPIGAVYKEQFLTLFKGKKR